jgi:Protein of unknown function (DUF3467)
MVWHTPFEFTLDFFAIQPVDQESPDVGQLLVTSRVKSPPTVIFDLLKALNENMTKYEKRFGEIPASSRRNRGRRSERATCS